MGRYEKVKSIVRGKLVDKTIDKDFADLSEELFGKGVQFNSSEVRKRCYGMKYLIDLLEEEGVPSNDDIIGELEAKKLELQKERMKLQAVKNELNRHQRFESRSELLYESIRNTIKALPSPKFNFNNNSFYNVNNKEEYVLAWADIHYGANFVSENNEYSRDIAKKRFENVVSKVSKLCVEKNIGTLNIVALGDELQGMLRISDVKLNDIAVVECVVEVSRIIANVLNKLSEYCDIKYYHTMASNHTQTRPLTGKPDLVREDLGFIIGNYIKDLLVNNNRVEVILSDKDYHSFQIAGQNILALHGHQVKGINKMIKDYSQLHRTFYDIALIGHFHGGQTMTVGESENGNTEVICVPSFIGSDPYSDSLKVGSKAAVKLFKFEEKNGISENYTIFLN